MASLASPTPVGGNGVNGGLVSPSVVVSPGGTTIDKRRSMRRQDTKLKMEVMQSTQATERAHTQKEFADLSHRAHVFRDKLIEEFRIEENVGFDARTAPKYSTADLFASSEPELFKKKVLLKNPHQLIKFKIFKRSQEQQQKIRENAKQYDKRLVRVKNSNSVPLDVWARWLSEHPHWNQFIFILVMSNAFLQGLQTGLSERDYPEFGNFFDVFDDVTLVIFSLEIIIKWTDSFTHFWVDEWNIFDFLVTAASAIPRAISLFVENSKEFQSVTKGLKLLRTVRILKMISRVESLQEVINTVVEGFRSLLYILFLLAMLTYLFAIFAINIFAPYTQSTDTTLQYQSNWSNLGNAFISLFRLLTLDAWYKQQADMQKAVRPWIVITFFVCWVWIGSFVFRNAFVGVMVKKFEEMSKQTTARLEVERQERLHKRNLQRLQKELLKRKNNQLPANNGMPDDGSGNNGNTDGNGSDGNTNGNGDTEQYNGVISPSAATTEDMTSPSNNNNGNGNGTSAAAAAIAPLSSRPTVGSDTDGDDVKKPSPPVVVGILKGGTTNVAAASSATTGAAAAVDPTQPPVVDDGMDDLGRFLAKLDQQPAEAVHANIPEDDRAELASWQRVVTRTLVGLAAKTSEHIWPRDTLFEYLRAMEQMQNNIKEYQDLQYLAAIALHEMYTHRTLKSSTKSGLGAMSASSA